MNIDDYKACVVLLGRVPVQGINEAKALIHLEEALLAKIKDEEARALEDSPF